MDVEVVWDGRLRTRVGDQALYSLKYGPYRTHLRARPSPVGVSS